MTYRLIKQLIFFTWLILLGLMVGRDFFIDELDSRVIDALHKAEQERYYGIWMNNMRIGYVAEKLQPDGDRIRLDQQAHLLLNVLETTQPIDMRVEAILNGSMVLQSFEFRFTSPFYAMSARGRVEGKEVHFTLDTGQAVISDTVTLTGPPLLAVNDRSYLLQELTGAGQKIKVPSFDPFSLSGRQSVITYHGEEKLLIRRRVQLLHHFSELFSGLRVNFWLDDKGRVVKEESPAGFTFIAEPEFRAKDVVRTGEELLSAVAVSYRGRLPPDNAECVTYRLRYPSGPDFDLHGGRQSLEGGLLTISRERYPAGSDSSAGDCGGEEFVRPSRYVQSDDTKIRELAESVAGSESEPAAKIRLLADWVFRNLEKRPVIGLPDALTTLKNRRGDCNEHASLFAALARSLDIPTAIATGVALQDDAFYYHAWNEVCINDRWYTLDTTTNQIPADLFHIRFGIGDLEEQLKIGALPGQLEIEIVAADYGHVEN